MQLALWNGIYLLNYKKQKSNFGMNPNHMFKQPVEVTEKQLKHPKVTVIVAFIAMHGLLQTRMYIFLLFSKYHFI